MKTQDKLDPGFCHLEEQVGELFIKWLETDGDLEDTAVEFFDNLMATIKPYFITQVNITEERELVAFLTGKND